LTPIFALDQNGSYNSALTISIGLGVFAAIFASYLRPDMVVSFANAVMALCGFPTQASP